MGMIQPINSAKVILPLEWSVWFWLEPKLELWEWPDSRAVILNRPASQVRKIKSRSWIVSFVRFLPAWALSRKTDVHNLPITLGFLQNCKGEEGVLWLTWRQGGWDPQLQKSASNSLSFLRNSLVSFVLADPVQNHQSFFVGPRSCYLWQPTIIGSQFLLVHSDWLPSVLQTEDQQRRTDDFVCISSQLVSLIVHRHEC